MTRHIHLTPLGGLAGDMFVAAMLDALPDLRVPVLDSVAAVLPQDQPAPQLVAGHSGGLAVLRFSVPPFDRKAPVHYPDMAAMIAGSGAPAPVRDIAADLLRQLAEAEAQVHGCPLEQVHFHEIADWDTLADLTATAAIFAALDGAGWSLDPLPLGGGTIETRHGTMPVPAPATAQLLRGLPVQDDGIGGERVTPTGACIARHIVLRIGLSPRPAGTLLSSGSGAGTRTLPGRPNVTVVRVLDVKNDAQDIVTTMEFDIDDMTAEELAAACDSLRSLDEVLDLTTHPVFGKKGRIATRIRLLTPPSSAETVAAACFRLTSTIGLRLHEERRLVLPRTASESGGVRLKTVTRPDGTLTRKAESDDLAGLDSLSERRRLARRTEDGT